jgi:hypothetical protein
MSLKIFDTISNALQDGLRTFIANKWQFIGDTWNSFVAYVNPKVFSDIGEAVNDGVGKLQNGEPGKPSTWGLISPVHSKVGAAFVSGTTWVLGIFPLIYHLLEHGHWNSYMKFLDYEANLSAKPELPGVGSLVKLQARNPQDAEAAQALAMLGYGEWARQVMFDEATQVLSAGDIWTLYVKEDRADEAWLKTRLNLIGWPDADITMIDKLNSHDVDPSTLVTMMFRGSVEGPEVVTRLARQGFTLEAAKDLVDVSWTLPPTDSIVNAMYAGDVTEADLAAHFHRQGIRDEDSRQAASMAWMPLQAANVVNGVFRGLLTDEEASRRFQRLGTRPEDVPLLMGMIHPRPDVGTAISLYRRGQIKVDEAQELAKVAGYAAPDAANMVSLYRTFLGVGDVVDLAARDSATGVGAATWADAAEEPSTLADDLAKHGFAAEDATRLWRRHWTLPGLAEVIDAWHRQVPGNGGTVIQESDVDSYMIAAGIPPKWREVIKAIQYSPLPLRILSSMYQRRVIDDAGAREALLNNGFRPDIADAYVAFLVKEYGPDSLHVSSAEILDSYRKAIVDRATAGTLLVDSGLSTRTAEFYLEREDALIEHDKKKLNEASIKAMLHNGIMSGSDARDRMHKLGWDGADIEELIAEWTVEGEPKAKAPKANRATLTHAEIDTLVIDGYIDEPTWHNLMGEIGYSDRDTEYLWSLVVEKAGKAQAAAEKKASQS